MDKPEEYILDNEIPTISFIRIGQSLGMAGEMVNGEIVNGESKEKSEIESKKVKK